MRVQPNFDFKAMQFEIDFPLDLHCLLFVINTFKLHCSHGLLYLTLSCLQGPLSCLSWHCLQEIGTALRVFLHIGVLIH